MYHDTIKIIFKNYGEKRNVVDFEYNFLISKNSQNHFSPIKYGELLQKFNEIGLNLKYVKFYDIQDDDTIVYCTYNFQENFNVFFLAYKKFISSVKISITFEYGNIINGFFQRNNMNYFSGIFFIEVNKVLGDNSEDDVIYGKVFEKRMETYSIIDKDGSAIAVENTTPKNNFEQHFFEKYEVKVALRKYKLSRLKTLFND